MRRAVLQILFPMGAGQFHFLVFQIVVLVVLGLDLLEYITLRSMPLLKPWAAVTQQAAIALCALVYGVNRALSLHPLMDKGFSAWLRQTPWAISRPLPFGPVQLTWRDLSVLVVLILLYRFTHSEQARLVLDTPWQNAVLLPSTLFLGAFLLGHTGVLVLRGPRWASFMLLLAWGGVVLLFPNVEYILLAEGLMYAFAMPQMRAALRRLPFEEPRTTKPKNYTGWYYGSLAARQEPPWPTFFESIMISILVGWWYYVIIQTAKSIWPQNTVGYQAAVWAFCAVGLVTLVGGRLCVYLMLHRTPLGIFARVFTGRFFIPGYDQVFVAPLCAFAVAGFAWLPMVSGGRVVAPVLGASMAAIAMICLTMGPSLKRWRLTGNHCLREANPSPTFKIEFPILQPKKANIGPVIGARLRMCYFNRRMLTTFLGILAVMSLVTGLGLYTYSGKPDDPAGFVVAALALIAATVSYAAIRPRAFHPQFRLQYAQWLRQTPWAPGKPLPLGPVHFVWQDLPILFLLMLFCVLVPMIVIPLDRIRGIRDMWSLVILVGPGLGIQMLLFFAAYTLSVLPILRRSGQKFLHLSQLFLIGYFVRVFPTPLPVVTVLTVLFLVSYWGLLRALRFYPWEDFWNVQGRVRGRVQNGDSSSDIDAVDEADVGWHYYRLSTKVARGLLDRPTRALIALLIGWWTHVVLARIPEPEVPESFSYLFVATAGLAAILRIVLYLDRTRPPISLLGRIATGRLLIPAFDKVFLTPLAAVFAAFLLVRIGMESGLHYSVFLPISVVVVSMMLLFLGPSFRSWRLTGGYAVGRKRSSRAKRLQKMYRQNQAGPSST